MDDEAKGISGASNPLAVLRAAITAVPSMRYALAVLGLLAIIAVATTWGVAPSVALVGVPIMMVFMVGLVVFAALAKASLPALRLPVVVLLWSFLSLMIAGTLMLFLAFFFSWPRSIKHMFHGAGMGSGPEPRDAAEVVLELDTCLEQERINECSAPRKAVRELFDPPPAAQ